MQLTGVSYKIHKKKLLVQVSHPSLRRKYQKTISSLGGRWNSKDKDETGWFLPLESEEELKKLISTEKISNEIKETESKSNTSETEEDTTSETEEVIDNITNTLTEENIATLIAKSVSNPRKKQNKYHREKSETNTVISSSSSEDEPLTLEKISHRHNVKVKKVERPDLKTNPIAFYKALNMEPKKYKRLFRSNSFGSDSSITSVEDVKSSDYDE